MNIVIMESTVMFASYIPQIRLLFVPEENMVLCLYMWQKCLKIHIKSKKKALLLFISAEMFSISPLEYDKSLKVEW